MAGVGGGVRVGARRGVQFGGRLAVEGEVGSGGGGAYGCILGRAQFLVETIAAQRKFRAAQRATEIRSKPPTKTQLMNLMMTYLKNTGGYKHSQLNGKTYEEIHELYKRQQKRNHDFIPMDSEKEA
ncbi:hypothetical protein Tco_1516709 [Tanacetum coccineum]